MKLLLGLVIIFCSTGLLKCSITICKKKVPKFPVSYNDIQSTMKDLVIGDKDIHIDHTSFNFTHPAIRLAGELDRVTVSNMFEYTLHKFEFIDIKHYLIFNITFHNISVEGLYDMRGNLGELFDIFGKGDFWFQMINFNIAATMEWPPYVNTTAICATSDVDVSVQQVKNHFYNLMGDPELEELMNDAMESLGPEMVQILWKEFKEFYGDKKDY